MDAGEFEQPRLDRRVDLRNVEGSGEPPNGFLVLTLEGPVPTERCRQLVLRAHGRQWTSTTRGQPACWASVGVGAEGSTVAGSVELCVRCARIGGHPSSHTIERGVAISRLCLERRCRISS